MRPPDHPPALRRSVRRLARQLHRGTLPAGGLPEALAVCDPAGSGRVRQAFRDLLGCSAEDYLVQARLQRLCRHLRGGEPLDSALQAEGLRGNAATRRHLHQALGAPVEALLDADGRQLAAVQVSSPWGEVAVRAHRGKVVAVQLPGAAPTLALHPPVAGTATHRVLRQARRDLETWFRRGGALVSSVPVTLSGSPFQVRVWQALRRVRAGHVVTYGQLATRVGRPGAARAVGRAVASNPVPLLVPCHRVVRASGEPGDFGGGRGLKRALLELEGSVLTREP